MTKLFSKESRYGYMEVDHRQSPGAFGVPAGQVMKAKTFTCPKCQRIVIKNPDRDRNRGYCRKCDHDLCDGCALLLKLNHECTVNSCWHVRQIHVT